MKKVWSLLLVTFSLLIVGCSDDDKVPADADDNFITALTLTKDGNSYDAVIEGNDIVVTVPYIIDLNGAIATMIYTSSAKILPNPQTVTDWDNEMIFRVTSFNGETNEYSYKVVKVEIESEGDVILKSQSDVDAFAETKVSVIKGNLVIGENAENAAAITNLEALAGIKEITGSLQILDNFKGEALDGLNVTKVGGIQFGAKETSSTCSDTYRFRLESLQEITGNLELNNAGVQFIEFDNLTKVEGNIYIKGDAVTSLLCPNLVEVDGNFDLSDNNEMPLAQLELSALETVKGKFGMIPSDNLLSLRLPKLHTAGSINFYVGWGLKTLEIPELSEVNGDLFLSSRYESYVYYHKSNLELVKIEGLNKLSQVKGILTISCFDALMEFPDFSTLTLLGGIYIDDLETLVTQRPLLNLSNVSFQTFNDIEPSIEITSTAFGEVRTKEDLSHVNVDLSFYCTDEKCLPVVNFKKTGDFQGAFSLRDVTSTNPTIPLEEVMGDARISFSNCSNKNVDCSFLKKVEGNFEHFASQAKLDDLSNLSSVGGYAYFFTSGCKDLKLDNLTTVNLSGEKSRAIPADDRKKGLFIMASADITLPSLEEVGGICGFMNYTGLSCPKLKTVSEKLMLSVAPNCTEVSFPELNSVPTIVIENMGKLSDFSTFATVIDNGSVTEENWTVTGCKYNPTYQDMKEGRYKPAE